MEEPVLLTGNDLSRSQVIAVALHNQPVKIDISRLIKSREYIEKKVEGGYIVYGVTTGFGSNADKYIEEADTKILQVNLLRSHACGVGRYFSTEITRAIMVIRLNTLLKGFSGVQESTVRQLEFMINHRIHPLIPEQGSVGASGDLCPLSHMALPLIGEGDVEYKGRHYLNISAEKNNENWQAFQSVFNDDPENKKAKINFQPIVLSYKEGLALNNGTTVMAAIATVALHRAERLLRIATLSSALIFESLGARKDAFAYPTIHRERNHVGQIQIAGWLTKLLDGSRMINIRQEEIIKHVLEKGLTKDPDIIRELKALIEVAEPGKQKQIPDHIIYKLKGEGETDLAEILEFAKKKWKPQDSYSIRCVPQVFGASKAAIDHVISIVDGELNAAVDNPLIFADDDKVVSGGNFHGQPIALVMDYLKLAVAEIGNITERQVNKMVDHNTNDCLPAFLVTGAGLNNGLMIPQYAAASLVSENKVLVHPASADSIPTCENTEDHVSMGTIAARQAMQIIENVEQILSIAIMTGYYAFSIRMEQFDRVEMPHNPENVLGTATLEFYRLIAKTNPAFADRSCLHTDRYLSPEITNVHAAFEKFGKIAEGYCG